MASDALPAYCSAGHEPLNSRPGTLGVGVWGSQEKSAPASRSGRAMTTPRGGDTVAGRCGESELRVRDGKTQAAHAESV